MNTMELIALINEPLAAIGEYLNRAKEAEKEAKRREIRSFYDSVETLLGGYRYEQRR